MVGGLAHLPGRLYCNPGRAHRLPTGRHPTVAARAVQTQFVQVVCSDLFTWGDQSEGIQKDPSAQNDYFCIRLARVIDVLCAVTAATPVNGPFRVNITDAL